MYPRHLTISDTRAKIQDTLLQKTFHTETVAKCFKLHVINFQHTRKNNKISIDI